MADSEAKILRAIRAALNGARNAEGAYRCRVVRNTVGFSREPRKLTYGLGLGSADLVGAIRGGRLFVVEVKRPGEAPSANQRSWLAAVRGWGGAAFCCHGVAGAMRALADAENGSEGWEE